MKIAIVGSRSIKSVDLEVYLPEECEEIVSGEAEGVDSCALNFANLKEIKVTEFLPEYNKYGRAAPIVRNRKIVEYSDAVIAFWDGISRGTRYVIEYCRKRDKRCRVVLLDERVHK